MSKELTITGANFEDSVTKSTLPVLLDFWAEWCGPCKMIGPSIDQLATEYDGKAVVGKVNIDQHPELAERFGVMSIPTLIFFKEGKQVGQIKGAYPKNAIAQELEKHLN